MSSAVKKKAACTCCGKSDPPCPDGQCPAGSLYRVACGGAHQYVQRFEMSGGASASANGGVAFALPIYYFQQGGYTNNFQVENPTRATLAGTFTLSKPVAPPGPQSGNYSTIDVTTWQGLYKRITIGGTTYVFDGTVGIGVAVDSLAFTIDDDPSIWPDYPVSPNGDHFQPPGAVQGTYWEVKNGPTVMFESTTVNVAVSAYPSVSAGTGSYQAGVSAGATSTSIVKALVGIFQKDVNGTKYPYADFWQAGSPTATTGISASGDNTGNTDVCHGYLTTANLVNYASPTPTTIGTFTGGFVSPDDGTDGVSVANYAIRNCPCAIRVSGTIYVTVRTDTGKPISEGQPPKLDPESEDYEVAPSALGPASIDVRMVRAAGKNCGHPSAAWDNVGPVHYNANGESSVLTGKLTVGDVDYPLDYTELRRIGPRLYALSGNFTGAETYDGESNSASGTGAFGLHFTTSGDCPTDLAEVEQFAQQYVAKRAGESPGNPRPDVEPFMLPANPAVTEAFTANDLAVEQVARETGDPACGCNESTTYHASLAAAAHVQSILDDDAGADA